MNRKTSQEEAERPMSVVPTGIRELLEQRGTYREWLRRLDEVGGQYRSDVAERVRADYQTRLESVAEELEGHRHELVSTLDRRRSHLDELSGSFERRSAELEEAELRFQVGEYDDATWDQKRSELTEGLEEIEAELNDERGAVEELERVLGALSGEGAPAGREAPVPVPTSASKAPADTAPDEELDSDVVAEAAPSEDEPAEEPAAPEAREATEPSESSGASESAEEEEVEAAETADEVAKPAPSEAVAEDEGGSDDYMDELEFLESLSLDDPDSFDAVSRMLEDEEDR